MAIRNIPVNLPDGQEDALIAEFSTYNGWDGQGSAAAYAKKIIAAAIVDSLKSGRKKTDIQQVVIETDSEIDALNIS